MADTPFELSMDEYVRQHLPWTAQVQFRRNTGGSWEHNIPDIIKEDREYRVGFSVTNRGSETYVKNVEIRVANAYPARVRFFSDDTYSQVDQDQQINLRSQAVLAPDQSTPVQWVYFKLGEGRMEVEPIAGVGVYAEIIPQGHYWGDLYKPLE
jgi:hypothetical protein